MYGLVNKAVQDLLIRRFGAEKWDAIRAEAGVATVGFVSMQSYPDELTYDLVAAASRVLGVSAEKLLEEFGEHWTVYTAREGYGELLGQPGDDLVTFLLDLDHMHQRIALGLPEFQPPSFRIEQLGEDRLHVHYYSHRRGLAPMVLGLLRGLGVHFGVAVDVTRIGHRGAELDHDVFELVIRGPAT